MEQTVFSPQQERLAVSFALQHQINDALCRQEIISEELHRRVHVLLLEKERIEGNKS